MDGPRDCHTQLHKSEREKQIPYINAYMWKLEKLYVHAQSCLTLCDPMDSSLPGSSVHGISQARILHWVAISFFRGSSGPRSPALQVDSLPTEPEG